MQRDFPDVNWQQIHDMIEQKNWDAIQEQKIEVTDDIKIIKHRQSMPVSINKITQYMPDFMQGDHNRQFLAINEQQITVDQDINELQLAIHTKAAAQVTGIENPMISTILPINYASTLVAQIQKYETEQQRMVKSLEEANLQIEIFRNTNAKLEKSKTTIARLNQEKNDSNAQMVVLRGNIAENDKAKVTMTAQLEQKDCQIAKFQELVKNEQSQRVNLENQANQYSQATENLKIQLEKVSYQAKNEFEHKLVMEQRIGAYETEIKELKSHLNNAEGLINRLQYAIREKEDKLENIKNETNYQCNELNKMITENSMKRDITEQQEMEIQRMKQIIIELNKYIQKKDKEISNQESDQKQMEQQIIQYRTECEKSKKEKEIKVLEYNEIEYKYRAIREQLESAELKIKDLQGRTEMYQKPSYSPQNQQELSTD
ncbi:hypothetical protein RFI_39658 [Reticulomyxa filosa]|uniref:Uncharacterized protein n=1 Tax=Reticulomyxa filosa TaxID=46433 RepID=X6L8T0_RETFI|nr:hypothetical protein RFI_39658 [Reticulomyxa filosa]|eukprot:ETN97868.1 hypothetical protein RFI_39658 [Reticulomyxa filosa]